MTANVDGRSETGDSMFDNPEALVMIARNAFRVAARNAIEENDRLGIPSYGSWDGKITVRLASQGKISTGPA